MLVSDLVQRLDSLAPFSLAEPWDNCGLLIGNESAPVSRVLVTLELTDAVLDDALSRGFDTVVTHHPVLFSPLRRLVESDPGARVLRTCVREGINVIACHTNLDAAPGGIAQVVGEAIGLRSMVPLRMAPTGWVKFVGFVPEAALTGVAGAVFAAGAGTIGDYKECAYATGGDGWFTPQEAARPAIGEVGKAERVPEVRWETVVPRGRLDAAIRAYVESHPYEEPAFDIYPVEDRSPRSGLGRLGSLEAPIMVEALALRVAEEFGLSEPVIGGSYRKPVDKVAVLPGSGRSLLAEAASVADVFITGDLSYHDSQQALDLGLALISLPHGELEWAAMGRWAGVLRRDLSSTGATVSVSEAWRSPWERAGAATAEVAPAVLALSSVTLWIDGGSRGNPGPSAIGVVLEDAGGALLEELGRAIGMGTNNAAEYAALIEGLDLAARHHAREVQINSDSELLVRQMQGDYRVKNEGLKDLFAAAKEKAAKFDRAAIRHVVRQENARADRLVNEALDSAAGKTSGDEGPPRSGGRKKAPGLF